MLTITDDWVLLPRVASAWHDIATACADRQTAITIDEAVVATTIQRLLPPGVLKNDDGTIIFGNADQRRAIAGLSGQRLGVLSGGPGTGNNNRCRSVTGPTGPQPGSATSRRLGAAPTGKAANRLRQSLLNAQHILQLNEDEKDFLAALEPHTLHRALGWRPDPTGTRRSIPLWQRHAAAVSPGAHRRISMTDISLSATVLQALPATAPLFFSAIVIN